MGFDAHRKAENSNIEGHQPFTETGFKSDLLLFIFTSRAKGSYFYTWSIFTIVICCKSTTFTASLTGTQWVSHTWNIWFSSQITAQLKNQCQNQVRLTLLEEILPWWSYVNFTIGWSQDRNSSTILSSVNISILNVSAAHKAWQLAFLQVMSKIKGSSATKKGQELKELVCMLTAPWWRLVEATQWVVQLSTLQVPKSFHNSYVLSLEQQKLGHPHEKMNITLGKFV